MSVHLPVEGAKVPRIIIALVALLDITITNRTHRAVILAATRIGFVLGWRFLMGWAFESIVIGMDLVGLVARSSIFTAREAASVFEGISGILKEGVDSLDGSARTAGLVPEVEAVAESTEVEGSFLVIGLGRGFNTRLELHK